MAALAGLAVWRYMVVANRRLEVRVQGRTRELEREVAERRRAEAALRESEERYALAARGANDGLWDWQLDTNRLYLSPRWRAMLGWDGPAAEGQPAEWFGRVHPEDLPQLRDALNAHLEGLAPHFENEHRVLHGDGTYRWMLCRGLAVVGADGRPTRMAGSLTDVTERKEVERQLLHDAFHDALTGLPNRALFLDRLELAFARTQRRRDTGFAVLFLDLDRFKLINDSLGHLAGDQLLIAVARRLEGCVRPGDTVARLGGDEFAILLDDLHDPAGVGSVVRRLQEGVALPLAVGGREVYTSVSIGVAVSSMGYERPEEILRDADVAMYRAKGAGGARHEMFNRAMHSGALDRLNLETDLRRALQRQEFELHFQPIFSLADGRVSGFEALVRWRHPARGLVGPDCFIAVAEEMGLILPLGGWVLAEACATLGTWQERFPNGPGLVVSVNLSPRQLVHGGLLDEVRRVLAVSGLAPRSLRLEITEGAIVENPAATAEVLRELKRLGIGLCIDDFGTGYSSLSSLQHFPIDGIKIDRSFIAAMGMDGARDQIVRAVVGLAHSLHMEVVAEGVETEGQLARIRQMGCDLGQGFLLAHPLERLAATELLERESGVAPGPLGRRLREAPTH